MNGAGCGGERGGVFVGGEVVVVGIVIDGFESGEGGVGGRHGRWWRDLGIGNCEITLKQKECGPGFMEICLFEFEMKMELVPAGP